MYLKHITFLNYEQQTIMLLRHSTTMFDSLKNSEDQSTLSFFLREKSSLNVLIPHCS